MAPPTFAAQRCFSRRFELSKKGRQRAYTSAGGGIVLRIPKRSARAERHRDGQRGLQLLHRMGYGTVVWSRTLAGDE